MANAITEREFNRLDAVARRHMKNKKYIRTQHDRELWGDGFISGYLFAKKRRK